jgi:hypothetical protein
VQRVVLAPDELDATRFDTSPVGESNCARPTPKKLRTRYVAPKEPSCPCPRLAVSVAVDAVWKRRAAKSTAPSIT